MSGNSLPCPYCKRQHHVIEHDDCRRRIELDVPSDDPTDIERAAIDSVLCCRECGAELVEGVALRDDEPVAGMPDFPGDVAGATGQTITMRSSGRLHPAMKCPSCGQCYEPGSSPSHESSFATL